MVEGYGDWGVWRLEDVVVGEVVVVVVLVVVRT